MSNNAIKSRPARLSAPEMMQVATNIDRYGLHLVHVGEGCDCGDCSAEPLPPGRRFGYTVGLTDCAHPELLVRGQGARETAELLNRWGGVVLDGQTLDAGHLLCEGPGGPTWELVPVRRASQVLVWAWRYYCTAGFEHTAGFDPLSALELIPARRPCPCDGCC